MLSSGQLSGVSSVTIALYVATAALTIWLA